MAAIIQTVSQMVSGISIFDFFDMRYVDNIIWQHCSTLRNEKHFCIAQFM